VHGAIISILFPWYLNVKQNYTIIILKQSFKNRDLGGVDWVHLDYDKDQWWVLKITVMNFQIPLKEGKILSISMSISFSRRIPYNWLVSYGLFSVQL
jgi:hypothetical protein